MPTKKATVTKRSDGLFCSTLQVNGTRKYVYGKSEKEVRDKVAVLQRQVIVVGDLPKCGRRTVNDLLDAWIASVSPSLKPRTISDYQAISDRYIRPHLGTTLLSKLSPDHVQCLCARLQTTGKRRVPSHAHLVLHRACQIGVLWGWLSTNPCDRVVKPTYKPVPKEMWSVEQLRTFMCETADHWLHHLWVVGAVTGCRLGELLALRWEDVDWETRSISILRNVQTIRRQRVYSEPKTRAGKREVLLSPDGMAALKAQKVQQAAMKLRAGATWCNTDLVFTGVTGGVMDHGTVEQAMKREVDRLGLPRLTPHGLRHMAASVLLAKGLPVTAVSARLGHASPAITMSIYAHALKHQDQQAAAMMQEVLSR